MRKAVMLAFFTTLSLLSSAPSVLAQTTTDSPGDSRTFVVGGSVLLWSGFRTPQESTGFGFSNPDFKGTVTWPAAGVLLIGGASITQRWSVAAETTLRRAVSANIIERRRPAHYDNETLTPSYTERERLISVVARRRLQARRVDFYPMGGFSVSRVRQALTNRTGTITYNSGLLGPFPRQRPDTFLETKWWGLLVGTDVLFRTADDVSVTVGTRLHCIQRYEYNTYLRPMPAVAPLIFTMNAGIAWHPRIPRGRR